MTTTDIVTALENIAGSHRLFNPYRDHDPAIENATTPAWRRQNLTRYLHAMLIRRPGVLWLGEALSRRGARRTGVPFTGDRMLDPLAARLDMPDMFHHPIPPCDDPGSGTAQAIWRQVPEDLPLFWNAVMQAPHRGAPDFAIRTPSAAEIRANQSVFADLIALFAPHHILCIGRLAERCARPSGVPVTYVRHPAQGGLSAFREGCAAFLSGPQDTQA